MIHHDENKFSYMQSSVEICAGLGLGQIYGNTSGPLLLQQNVQCPEGRLRHLLSYIRIVFAQTFTETFPGTVIVVGGSQKVRESNGIIHNTTAK